MKAKQLKELKDFILSSQYYTGVGEEYSEPYYLNENFDFRVIVFPSHGLFQIVDASLLPFKDGDQEVPTAFAIREKDLDFDIESTLNHLRELDKLDSLYV